MPYASGNLKGQLTTRELRMLIAQHNKLVSMNIPQGMKRGGLIKLIENHGYSINHNEGKLVPRGEGTKKMPVVKLKEAPTPLKRNRKAEKVKKNLKDKEMVEKVIKARSKPAPEYEPEPEKKQVKSTQTTTTMTDSDKSKKQKYDTWYKKTLDRLQILSNYEDLTSNQRGDVLLALRLIKKNAEKMKSSGFKDEYYDAMRKANQLAIRLTPKEQYFKPVPKPVYKITKVVTKAEKDKKEALKKKMVSGKDLQEEEIKITKELVAKYPALKEYKQKHVTGYRLKIQKTIKAKILSIITDPADKKKYERMIDLRLQRKGKK